LLLTFCLSIQLRSPAAAWLRPISASNEPIWGLEGGLQFAIHPAGFRPTEPRGLIRLGYPVLPSGRYDLVNFIAIEPVVNGKKGYSELERSRLDNAPGKRISVKADGPAPETERPSYTGTISRLAGKVEELRVPLEVEKFDNGAHVGLTVTQRTDAPDEITLTLHAEADSASMEYCILTATMGNMARTLQLWLKTEIISSLKLYPQYSDTGFAPDTVYPLDRLLLTERGDVLVAITNDEEDPARVFPFPNSEFWHYGGSKVTQFWKKPAGTYRKDLQAVVNARYTYWMSRQPIPGGIAFENFELRERFYDSQQFVFGITSKTPAQLGFTLNPAVGNR
jgi:hypothetical protein